MSIHVAGRAVKLCRALRNAWQGSCCVDSIFANPTTEGNVLRVKFRGSIIARSWSARGVSSNSDADPKWSPINSTGESNFKSSLIKSGGGKPTCRGYLQSLWNSIQLVADQLLPFVIALRNSNPLRPPSGLLRPQSCILCRTLREALIKKQFNDMQDLEISDAPSVSSIKSITISKR
jgi:hypothetical protein